MPAVAERFDLNDFLAETREAIYVQPGGEFVRVRPSVICNDGFKMSVQASETHYCSPRVNRGPYSAVEVGFPSEKEDRLMEYAETPEDPTGTVYGWVPVHVIEEIVRKHGGIDRKAILSQER